MSQQDFNILSDVFQRLAGTRGRIARFSYTQEAYDEMDIESNRADNRIPDNSASALETSEAMLNSGIQTQGTSISRLFQNHFTGRMSFNLNMVIDTIVRLFMQLTRFNARNANEYDAFQTYRPGDVVYTVVNIGTINIFQWYIRTAQSPDGITGIPPTNTVFWQILREYTTTSRLLVNEAWNSFDYYTYTGLWHHINTASPFVVQNGPPLPQDDSGILILQVHSDDSNKEVIVQEVTYRDTAIQYTRTGRRNSAGFWQTLQDWYVSKNPKGMTIIGVMGVWTFRVEHDGHLRLYYYGISSPPVRIIRSGDPILATRPELLGHLVWEFDQISPPAQPPSVDLGPNVTLTLPTNSTTLSANITSDLPVSSIFWTRVSGPVTYTIATPNAASTLVSDLVEGVYVFQCAVMNNAGQTTTTTITVTVQGVSTGDFSTDSWAVINSTIQDVIAGNIANPYSVGDVRTETVDGQTAQFRIIAFNHDDLVGGGKAGMTVEINTLLWSSAMDTSGNNSNGWENSFMRLTTLPTIYSLLPLALRSAIKTVLKPTTTGSQSQTVTTVQDDIWLFSEIEITGVPQNTNAIEGSQYTIYVGSSDADRIKVDGTNTARSYWLRSPTLTNGLSYRHISNIGQPQQTGANVGSRVCFGFCI